MPLKVFLRPLQTEDAQISYRWRNNPVIWEHAGSKPDKTITPEIEAEWINKVLQRQNEKRFAICVCGTDEYIGNAQLTDITAEDAQLHIFIGETSFWGRGLGNMAIGLLLEFAFTHLALEKVYLYVTPENYSAINIYRKNNFISTGREKNGQIEMITLTKKGQR